MVFVNRRLPGSHAVVLDHMVQIVNRVEPDFEGGMELVDRLDPDRQAFGVIQSLQLGRGIPAVVRKEE
jgi:hypothetical protein